MFTDKAQSVIDLAKDYAFAQKAGELGVACVIVAFRDHSEAMVLFADCLGLSPEKVRSLCPEYPAPVSCSTKLPIAEPLRAVLVSARQLAEEVPDQLHPGLIDLRHLACALALSRDACAIIRVTPPSRADAVALLAGWYQALDSAPKLDELTEKLRILRTELLNAVFGQDHAIQAFVEGLFNAEVVAAADGARKTPRALLVFAGPPGVGKTMLAERGASSLGRPYKRFDMSAYSGHQQNEALVGMAKSFHGAHPGTLTEFVEKNPNAVLLFDEIEKAHLKTIHLFLQVLDAGTLEDKFHERNVGFRDTTIIFTTNAGKKLYDRPNSSGVIMANARFHRRTILDALENEKDAETGQPFFPAAICSRLATGYPVLFNHLGVNELERVARYELTRTAGLFERQYYKQVTFDDLVPICMVLREGVRIDARTLRSQAEAFAKTEVYKFCQLFKNERLEEVLEQVDRIHFGLEGGRSLNGEVKGLFEPQERPRVLLVANPDLCALYKEQLGEIEWKEASAPADALEILAAEDMDCVLLDLWLGRGTGIGSMSIQQFDHVPAGARRLDQGQELLRQIRERLPQLPVFLLSLLDSGEDRAEGSIDEELFLSCVRSGGARGMLVTGFTGTSDQGWKKQRDQLAKSLLDTTRRLHREKAAAHLGQERKVLTFDTVPHFDPADRSLTVRLKNLRLTRAIASADAGEVLDDVERPRVGFDDVIGAETAKEELRFFIDYLKNPKRFAALGLKPPKGVLLHGPPGTGKTLLARAVAGESNVAFISASASSFVTIWQGSGPQSIRDIFARARRYAPSIVFIDEIDAIGKVRTGSPGAGQAEENTLNALLTEMDGFLSNSPLRPVFVLAATNFRVDGDDQESPGRTTRTLDPALVRRFSRTILVGLPEKAARLQYLTARLKDRQGCVVSPATLSLIAERSSGMSIANLESILETAARNAARSGESMTDKLLEEAFESVRFGDARPRSEEFVKRTAYHEAGHTVMYWLSGWLPAYVTVVARGSHGGYMAPSADEIEGRATQTRENLLAQIRVCFGGRAAEMLLYGEVEGMTTGATNDLEQATNIARQMVCRFGMDEQFGVLATPELLQHEGGLGSPLYAKINEAANKILREQMDCTMKALKEKRDHLEAVAKALLEKERLATSELQAILPCPAQHTLSKNTLGARRSGGR